MIVGLLPMLIGCNGAPVALVAPSTVWVEASHVEAGQPIRLHVPVGVELPAVEGLSATQMPHDDPNATVWELRGEPGSYRLSVPSSAGEPVELFVDIGVDGPSGGPMEDLLAPPPEEPPDWPLVVGVSLAGVGLVGAGAWAWRRFRPQPPPPPPEPADVVARRAWAALRLRPDLDPAGMAAGLSAIYRQYLESVHAWPATSRTTREIVDALAGSLPANDLDRARRLLNAMDIVRFSDRASYADVFATLDRDFEALLARPVGALRA